LSIINHSCKPNCIKFSPQQYGLPSEVRAIQTIEVGEEITICYLVPQEHSMR